MKLIRLKTIIAAAAMLVGGAITAHASTVATCPDVTASRTFTLDPSSGCYAYGAGNRYGSETRTANK